MRAAARTLPAAVLLLILVACGGNGRSVPPGDEAGLRRTFEPSVEALGLRFSYGSVEDFPAGPHLALYLEPTGPTTDQQYLDRLLASTAAIASTVFDAYPDLNSFDICQEPVPTGPDDPIHPKPRTVIVLGRRQAATVADWSTATLADLITATRSGVGGEVTVDDPIAALPDYASALAEADRRRPAGTSTTGY